MARISALLCQASSPRVALTICLSRMRPSRSPSGTMSNLSMSSPCLSFQTLPIRKRVLEPADADFVNNMRTMSKTAIRLMCKDRHVVLYKMFGYLNLSNPPNVIATTWACAHGTRPSTTAMLTRFANSQLRTGRDAHVEQSGGHPSLPRLQQLPPSSQQGRDYLDSWICATTRCDPNPDQSPALRACPPCPHPPGVRIRHTPYRRK